MRYMTISMTNHCPLLAAAACAFTLAALSPLAARADAVADEADFRFNRAASFFKQGRLEEALSEFLSSNRLVRNRNVIFNIARCFEALKQPNEAHRFYSEILGDEMPETDRKNLLASLERLRPSLAILELKTNPPSINEVHSSWPSPVRRWWNRAIRQPTALSIALAASVMPKR